MYAGKVVEVAPVRAMFATPRHPYSQILIDSVPSLRQRKPLKSSEGITHDPRNPPPGCIFQLRCPHVMDICRSIPPAPRVVGPGQWAACHLYPEQPVEVGGNV
jgi:peptide/nickel transport system ATP-binding protein